MNEGVRTALVKLMARHGLCLARDSRRCEAWLHDLCPAHPREIMSLGIAIKNGVVDSILESDKSRSQELLVSQLANRLSNTTPVSHDLARWAVESWAKALCYAPDLQECVATRYIVVWVNVKQQQGVNPATICRQLDFHCDTESGRVFFPEAITVLLAHDYSIWSQYLVVLRAKVSHEPSADPTDVCHELELELDEESKKGFVSEWGVVDVLEAEPAVLLGVDCPFCESSNIVLAAGAQVCEHCEESFECDADGAAIFAIKSECPNCFERQYFNLHEQGFPQGDEALTWFVDCRFCGWSFLIKRGGVVVDPFLTDSRSG
jgi:hypothetical protein